MMEVAMAVGKISCAEPLAGTPKLTRTTMRVIEATARACCQVPFVVAALVLNSPAQADESILKYINVRQLLDEQKRTNTDIHKLGDKYAIRCNGTVCIGTISIMVFQKAYDYEAVITVLTNDAELIGLKINLRPTETACGPRCAEPSLNSISTSVPRTTKAHVTVPLKQFGDFSPTTSPGSATDLVYRTHPNPVAYLDLSVEFEQ
jgi:hypothetical protein